MTDKNNSILIAASRIYAATLTNPELAPHDTETFDHCFKAHFKSILHQTAEAYKEFVKETDTVKPD